MNNEKLLNQAILLLQDVNADELETVQINHTKYDDGSVGFTVELTYPNKEVSGAVDYAGPKGKPIDKNQGGVKHCL